VTSATGSQPTTTFDEDEQYAQLTTLQGWRRFVQHTPHIPDLIPDPANVNLVS